MMREFLYITEKIDDCSSKTTFAVISFKIKPIFHLQIFDQVFNQVSNVSKNIIKLRKKYPLPYHAPGLFSCVILV